MRCKACDALLTNDELKIIDPMTEQPMDLCFNCLEAGEDDEVWEDE